MREESLLTAGPASGGSRVQDGPMLTMFHLREYIDLGFTKVSEVITVEEAQHLRREALKIVAAPSVHSRVHRTDDAPGYFLVDILMSNRSQPFRQLALDPRVLRVAAHFIGASQFCFFYDQLFYKEAGTGTRTQWHQDLPFWPLQGHCIPSVWIALTEVDEQGSAVQYLPGSHRTGELFAAVDPNERDAAREAGINVCPEFHLGERQTQLRSHRLQPGDAIVHHPLVVHGAGPNRSSTDRVAVSLRYCASDTLWMPLGNSMYFPRTETIAAGTPVGELPMFSACVVPEPSIPCTQGEP